MEETNLLDIKMAMKDGLRSQNKVRDLSDRSIWKNKKLQALFLLILFVILFKPPIVKAIGNLFRSTFYAATAFQSFQLNLTTPHTGEHVLPSSVQEMLELLRSHHVVSYQISDQIKSAWHGLLYQRIVESAWPRRMSPQSNYKLIFISDLENSPNCREVERKKEVVLVFCR